MKRSPLQQAQARKINPFMGRKVQPSRPTSSWWADVPADQFYAEAKKREAIRQQESGRVVYPNREDVA